MCRLRCLVQKLSFTELEKTAILLSTYYLVTASTSLKAPRYLFYLEQLVPLVLWLNYSSSSSNTSVRRKLESTKNALKKSISVLKENCSLRVCSMRTFFLMCDSSKPIWSLHCCSHLSRSGSRRVKLNTRFSKNRI